MARQWLRALWAGLSSWECYALAALAAWVRAVAASVAWGCRACRTCSMSGWRYDQVRSDPPCTRMEESAVGCW